MPQGQRGAGERAPYDPLFRVRAVDSSCNSSSRPPAPLKPASSAATVAPERSGGSAARSRPVSPSRTRRAVALAAAAVLHHRSLDGLDRRVTYTRADLRSTPITGRHVATGMTLRQLCDAAVRYSDGTAGNLLLRDLGGPARLTAHLRGLGDTVSRMDHYEPELHDVPPEDPSDTTTPRAVATDFHKLLLGTALPAGERALLTDWLSHNATTVGARRIRAGLPKGWQVADKTGTGNYGRANDIAIVRPPRTDALVLAVMTDRPGYDAEPSDAEPSDALIAEATTRTITALGLQRSPVQRSPVQRSPVQRPPVQRSRASRGL